MDCERGMTWMGRSNRRLWADFVWWDTIERLCDGSVEYDYKRTKCCNLIVQTRPSGCKSPYLTVTNRKLINNYSVFYVQTLAIVTLFKPNWRRIIIYCAGSIFNAAHRVCKITPHNVTYYNNNNDIKYGISTVLL